MGTRLEQAPAVREFATAIGEWLLTQRFGTITPLAYRYRLREPRDPLPDELPQVVIELLANDPPPPPPEWHRFKDMKNEDMSLEDIGEWARGLTWPRADRDAIEEAAEARARALGIPDAIDPGWPVAVNLFGRSDARHCGFPPLND